MAGTWPPSGPAGLHAIGILTVILR